MATSSPLGATLRNNGVNIAVSSRSANQIDVCFYEKTGKKLIGKYPLPYKCGDVFYGFFENIEEGVLYGLRAYGDNEPNSGNRFNPHKLLIDPYALELNGQIELHEAMFDNEYDSADFVPKARIIKPRKVKSNINPINIDGSEVIYELNVRGFTKNFLDIPQDIRGTFSGLAHDRTIAYLKDLGVGIVELMPSCAWIDERHLPKMGLKNYWGYNPIGFMAPDPRLAPNGWSEIADCVKKLEKAGIKTILDVVFNHSGESDKYGPIVSMRGLDNSNYYRLHPQNNSDYINDAGTGNILDATNPLVINLVLDSLRAWRDYGGVHGFRFDLATTLGRSMEGFKKNSALIDAINNDSELSKLILIAEPWDCGPDGYQLGSFPDNWPEWNDKYRDIMRRFWLGDGVSLGEFATRFCGSEDIFYERTPSKTLNYIVAHDGFTLSDLVSFNHKNNYANGEENRDGSDNNLSNNHGFEGQTNDPQILSKRLRSQRALLTTLILSRGIPMISMGAEHGKSQNGNNNAYAQDNEVGYINWDKIDTDLLEFTRKLITIRAKHPALHDLAFLKGRPIDLQSISDVEWYTPSLAQMDADKWNAHEKSGLCIIFTNDSNLKDRVAILLNPTENALDFNLPKPRDNTAWSQILDTSINNGGESIEIKSVSISVASRSIIILNEVKTMENLEKEAEETLITKLSEALGIESQWCDVNGKTTIVPLETKLKLINSMGFSCATDCQTRDSLKEFCDKYHRRPIEFAVCSNEGDEAKIKLYSAASPGKIINIEAEDKIIKQIEAIDIEEIFQTDPDDRISKYYILKLDNLPIGRYKLWRDGFEEYKCALTIAPKTGYLPECLETERLSGLSSQIYALKRKGDQGIGDFSTLTILAENCQKNNLDIIGINPLHALFPAKKDLASPYYPSDRIALEPHYIDIGAIIPAIDASEFQSRQCVDYDKMWQYKSKLLEDYYAANSGAIEKDEEFLSFKRDMPPAIRQFAVFQAISEKYLNKEWRDWPKDLATREPKALESFSKENQVRIGFHLFLQFLCDKQLKIAANAGEKMKVGICRDLAIGTSPDGAEAWATQSKMAQNVSIGAPPDLLGPRGQIWGLPPLVPHLLKESAFKNIISLYRANMRHAGALRIDHAMGIMRQFWVPDGSLPADGAYVRFPFANILAELKLESHRAKCVIIGEDLGTVPEGFSETMNAVNALSYKVLQFEKNDLAFKLPKDYPKACFACISTHDLPPIKGWWKGVDIDERRELGLYTEDEAQKCYSDRKIEKRELLNALINMELIGENSIETPEISQEIVAAIHEYIALSPSYLAIAQIEDLAGEIIPINLPGTDRERPNWRNCVSLSIDEIFSTKSANSWSNSIITALNTRSA